MSGRISDGLSVPAWVTKNSWLCAEKDVSGESWGQGFHVHCEKHASDTQGSHTLLCNSVMVGTSHYVFTQTCGLYIPRGIILESMELGDRNVPTKAHHL